MSDILRDISRWPRDIMHDEYAQIYLVTQIQIFSDVSKHYSQMFNIQIIPNLIPKCHLQDLIVSFDVIKQMKQFWSEIKAGNFSNQLMPKSLQKVELMRFYMQIEWTYVIVQDMIENIMMHSLMVDNNTYNTKQMHTSRCYTRKTAKKKRKHKKWSCCMRCVWFCIIFCHFFLLFCLSLHEKCWTLHKFFVCLCLYFLIYACMLLFFFDICMPYLLLVRMGGVPQILLCGVLIKLAQIY